MVCHRHSRACDTQNLTKDRAPRAERCLVYCIYMRMSSYSNVISMPPLFIGRRLHMIGYNNLARNDWSQESQLANQKSLAACWLAEVDVTQKACVELIVDIAMSLSYLTFNLIFISIPPRSHLAWSQCVKCLKYYDVCLDPMTPIFWIPWHKKL